MIIQTEEFHVEVNGQTAHSLLSRPSDADKVRPGILLIPEFWGLVEYSQRRAHQLAQLGYCALAVDIYGGGKTCSDVQSAMEGMNNLLSDMDKTTDWLSAHLAALKKHEQVDSSRTAAMGYCLGGGLGPALGPTGREYPGRRQLSR